MQNNLPGALNQGRVKRVHNRGDPEHNLSHYYRRPYPERAVSNGLKFVPSSVEKLITQKNGWQTVGSFFYLA